MLSPQSSAACWTGRGASERATTDIHASPLLRSPPPFSSVCAAATRHAAPHGRADMPRSLWGLCSSPSLTPSLHSAHPLAVKASLARSLPSSVPAARLRLARSLYLPRHGQPGRRAAHDDATAEADVRRCLFPVQALLPSTLPASLPFHLSAVSARARPSSYTTE